MPKLPPYDQKNIQNIVETMKLIKKLYEAQVYKIAVRASQISFDGTTWSLSKYPALKALVNQVIAELHPEIYGALVNSLNTAWDLSNRKNDILVDKRLAGRKPSSKVQAILYDPNLEAFNGFIRRKQAGLNLSQRVWNTLDPLYNELELGLGVGISQGQSAIEMAQSLTKYLNDPDMLFRRVRDAAGELKLSKAAQDYHPGQGVYRSSFKNALRLTATETNIAYRTADQTRWKKLAFVVGYEVHTSSNHPAYDICDELAGRYPKDFIFKGWHPRCMCFTTPILMNNEEYSKYEDQILGIEKPGSTSSVNEVEKPPASFFQYVKDNKKRIQGWSTKPYWYVDNEKYVKQAGKELKGKLPVDYGVLKLNEYVRRIQEIPKYKGVFPELTMEEKASVHGYTDQEYWSLNSYLRGMKVNPLNAIYFDNYRNLLNNALDAIEQPFQGLTYRGTDLNASALQVYKDALKSGEPVTHDYFTSSSADPGSQFNGNTRFVILSRNGKQIESISWHGHEKEVLFKAGTKFKVTKIVKKDDGASYIYLQEID